MRSVAFHDNIPLSHTFMRIYNRETTQKLWLFIGKKNRRGEWNATWKEMSKGEKERKKFNHLQTHRRQLINKINRI
jgi:hypothetical protein